MVSQTNFIGVSDTSGSFKTNVATSDELKKLIICWPVSYKEREFLCSTKYMCEFVYLFIFTSQHKCSWRQRYIQVVCFSGKYGLWWRPACSRQMALHIKLWKCGYSNHCHYAGYALGVVVLFLIGIACVTDYILAINVTYFQRARCHADAFANLQHLI